MPKTRQIRIDPPIGGIDRAGAFTEQPPRSTIDAKNVWIIDAPTGRTRVSPRPGLTSVNSPTGAPYGWCRASWVTGSTPNFTTNNGVAVVTASGCFTWTGSGSWTARITTAPASTFASVCVHTDNFMYQGSAASATKVIRRMDMSSGTESDLNNGGGGTAPLGCGIVLSHADRLFWMGSVELPHAWGCSAAGDATNWDYASRLSTGAFAAVSTAGGKMKQPILAGLSRSDDELLIAGRTFVTTLQGNPRSARLISNSAVVGPVGNNAWCLDDENNCFMLSQAGPYVIPAGIGQHPQYIGQKIPNDLVGVNPGAGDVASVGYDHRWNMVHFNVDPNSGSDVTWSYHKPTQSWWKNVFADDIAHVCVPFPELRTDAFGAMLMIAGNGTAYQFQRASTETFDSYIWLPPVQLFDDFHDGIVSQVSAITAKFSDLWSGSYTGDMNWALYVGNSPEEAYYSTAAFTGTKFALEYLNYIQNPMIRGNWAMIKISDAANDKWILERFLLEVQHAGGRLVA